MSKWKNMPISRSCHAACSGVGLTSMGLPPGPALFPPPPTPKARQVAQSQRCVVQQTCTVSCHVQSSPLLMVPKIVLHYSVSKVTVFMRGRMPKTAVAWVAWVAGWHAFTRPPIRLALPVNRSRPRVGMFAEGHAFTPRAWANKRNMPTRGRLRFSCYSEFLGGRVKRHATHATPAIPWSHRWQWQGPARVVHGAVPVL